MKVIIPNKLELLSCSVAEGDEVDGALWEASTAYAKGADLSLDTALAGVSIPLHPGAERYYKEAGILK